LSSKIILIAAAAENNTLGFQERLPWHLPNDFKRFKRLTSGHKIIMGRKTLETFPSALPNREHIVITRNKNYQAPFECQVVGSMEEALALGDGQEDLYIIGGGEIYALGLPFATHIELTRVHTEVQGDAFFPDFSDEEWVLEEAEMHPSDDRHAHAFTFLTYSRKA
jgi:dihydrofolate reductase